MVRADEVSIQEYREDPAKYSFTYPTYPGTKWRSQPKIEAFSDNVTGPEVFHVQDRKVPVTHPSGDITVRIYSPEGPGPFPVHLNFHGGKGLQPLNDNIVSLIVRVGGWVLGGLKSEAAWCRHMCNKSSIKIIDVDYRMGPEQRFPTAIYDCWDAVKWVYAPI